MIKLTETELIEITGGTKEKERSTFDSALSAIGGIIGGTAGMIASWF